MKKILAWSAALVFAVSPVLADQFTDYVTRLPTMTPPLQATDYTPVVRNAIPYKIGATSFFSGSRSGLGVGIPVSISDFGARHDALTFADGVATSGSASFSSATATFTSADVGKKIQIDGAAGIASAPLKTTIAAVTGAHTITLGAAASATTPLNYAVFSTVVTPRASGSYVPGETMTVTGGTSTVGAVIKVLATKVTATSIVAGGTGGTDGSCRVMGTTGTGTFLEQTVTIAGGAITAVGSLTEAGHYLTAPTNLAVEPVSSAPGFSCAPTGATLALTMGVQIARPSTAGNYSVLPANPVATGAGSISGATGATFTVQWNQSGSFVYGHDDSAALAAAITQAATLFAAGAPAYVFAPAGNYLIDATATPLMQSALGIVGEGSGKTNFILGGNYSGDLFAWSEAWLLNSIPLGGTTAQVSNNKSGPKALGFSVWGNRLAAVTQNALVFYDRNDQVLIDDVDVNYINGRCLYSGVVKNQTDAFMRESRMGRIRCYNTGATGVPSVEFTSQGGGDGTDEIDIDALDIYAPYDAGFWIRNEGTGSVRAIRIGKLRVEGLQRADFAADLMTIGDPTATGTVHDIYISQITLTSPYWKRAALVSTAPNSTVAPYLIQIDGGSVGGGEPIGYGVQIDAGRNAYYRFSDIFTYGTNFTTSSIAAAIFVDGAGKEQAWTYSLATPGVVSSPTYKVGYPRPIITGNLLPAVVPALPDTTVIGGNARGAGAVDLQLARVTPAQVASGLGAVIAGGSQNTSTGLFSSVLGGFVNTASGTATAVLAGQRANDRGSLGGAFSSAACADFNLSGSCQRGWFVLGKTTNGAAGVRLTSDQGAAASTNCVNVPIGTAYQTVVRVVARNRTTVTDSAGWNSIQGLLARAAGNAAYNGAAGGVPDTNLGGGLATATIAVAADTTNQCLDITFTPPALNTDIIDVTATIDTVEVQ